MKTEELIAKQEIHDVLMRYCRAVDRLDEELLRSVYFPDAWDDHGLFSGTRDDLIAWVIPFLRDNFTTSIHAIHNLLIEVNGDAAFSEAYFTGYYYTQHNGALHTRISCGRYIDRFERRNGEWRIAKRTVVNDWSRLDPLEQSVAPKIPGCRGHDDPVYRLRQEYLYG
jgi:hypothetical protein